MFLSLQILGSKLQYVSVLSCIDAVLDSIVAIITLQTGGVLIPFPLTPIGTENATSETTHDEMASVYNVNWLSATTSGISYNSSLSAQTQAPSQNTTTGGNSSQKQPMSGNKNDYYLIVGPVMYVNFSAANTSDAGFTVDLLFQHPSYFEVSRLLLLYCSFFPD